jgi:hypothetical protein
MVTSFCEGQSDFAEYAPVSVPLRACDRHGLAKDRIRKTLHRVAAVVLISLRRVYAGETGFVLTVAGAENHNRVAVAHADNLAGDGLQLSSGRQTQREKNQQCSDNCLVTHPQFRLL